MINSKAIHPQIYVFEEKHKPGWLKVGETTQEEIDYIEETITPMPTSDDLVCSSECSLSELS